MGVTIVMMKRVLLAGAAALLGISAANAADMTEPAAFDWTGPYVGLQVGYGWGKNDVDFDQVEEQEALAIASSPPSIDPFENGSIGMDGVVGGLHAGYNWQMNSLVLGVEGDGELSGMTGDVDIEHDNDPTDVHGVARQDIDWLGSLRLRAGFAMDRALFYATGGLAVGGVEVKVTTDPSVESKDSETLWGWTVGGGVEYALTDSLTARVEYRYTDLGDTNLKLNDETADDLIMGPGSKMKFDNTFHAIRVGMSWRF